MTTDSERIEALENRIKILESVLANLLASIEADEADAYDDAAPLEDMEGIRLPDAPGRGVSTW